MELEVPDEAESAEAGAVTAEAAWSAESGAAAGKCDPPGRCDGLAPLPRRGAWSRPPALRCGAACRANPFSSAARGFTRSPIACAGEGGISVPAGEAAPPRPGMRGSQRSARFRVLG